MPTRPDRRRNAKRDSAKERVFEGLGVAPGIAIGPAYLRESGEIQVTEYKLPQRRLAAEAERFEQAVAKAGRQIDKLKRKAESVHGRAAEELGYLLDAHSQMLGSSRLIKGVLGRIADRRINAEAALRGEVESIAGAFAELDDPYLRTRGEDIREVGYRILRNLSKADYESFAKIAPSSIIVAEEITPADTALMDPRQIGGFSTVLGGAEGHTAIMARSLGLPAVLGVTGLLGGVAAGETVIVDGSRGRVIVNPTAKRLADYRLLQREMEREHRALSRLRDLPAVTRDAAEVTLHANLELPREAKQAVAVGAEGIGLLRTEFLYMNRDDLPDVEEQTAALEQIVAAMGGRPVTVRTLDVGGEKLATALGAHLSAGANPALGLRAIRLSLKRPELLETQLTAILRAGVKGPVRILLPMISSVGEVRSVRKILAKLAKKLAKQGVAIADPLPPLGVMIEIPGAALAADALAHEADFFAIGTNDLTMYTLAIDRGEEQVAYLYNPLHPAVLRLIQFTVGAAQRAGKPLSICGEIAGDPRFTALLLGLGVRELSMSAAALPRVKARIRQLDSQAAASRALAIMDQTDIGRIAAMLDDFNETL
ncbi:MAG: phosphoenolpyruvate--protein phosphotransferase [Rhodovibrionaceae bacterium]